MIRRLVPALLFLLACSARPAMADGGNCTISATGVVFGSYSGAVVNITGTITVKCTGNATYDVGLNAGTSSGATITKRSMTGPSSILMGYGLYSDAAHTLNWGNSAATGWVARQANGNSQPLTVYAQLPASQNVVSGSYTDTITATVTTGGGDGGGSTSTTFTVAASVVNACTISAHPLAFGTYSGVSVTSTSTIIVTCTKSVPYNVGLSAGTASGATVTNRSMTGPAGALMSYKLFSNSALTTNWGNTVGTDTLPGSGTGLAQSQTVYGQIPAGQLRQVGSYSDTITATITY